jgi:hypothetical protein
MRRFSAGRSMLPPENHHRRSHLQPESSLGTLAGNVGMTCIALCIDRVVFLIQAFSLDLRV